MEIFLILHTRGFAASKHRNICGKYCAPNKDTSFLAAFSARRLSPVTAAHWRHFPNCEINSIVRSQQRVRERGSDWGETERRQRDRKFGVHRRDAAYLCAFLAQATETKRVSRPYAKTAQKDAAALLPLSTQMHLPSSTSWLISTRYFSLSDFLFETILILT